MALQNNASNPTIANLNYTGLAFPGPAAYPFYSASQSNMCNVYLPNDSTLSRWAQIPLPPQLICIFMPSPFSTLSSAASLWLNPSS